MPRGSACFHELALYIGHRAANHNETLRRLITCLYISDVTHSNGAGRGLFSRRATKEKHMADFSETDIRAALSQVRDPAGDTDIIASGRVQGLVLRGPNVGFSLDVAGLAESTLADLQSAAENATRGVAGVTSVTCVLTAHNDAPSLKNRATHRLQ